MSYCLYTAGKLGDEVVGRQQMTPADWYMSHVWRVHRSRLTSELRAESWTRGSGLLGSFTRWWGLGSWCAGPPFFFFFHCVCPLKPSWILGQSDPCRHVLSAHRGVDFWGGSGGREREPGWDFLLLEKHVVYETAVRDRTEADSEFWQK